jgi:signal transduction histidine kinase
MTMGLASWLVRPLRPRRVRLRLTAMYGVLFLLCAAALLAISGGLAVTRTSQATVHGHLVAHPGQQPPHEMSANRLLEARLRALQAQVNDYGQTHTVLSHQLLQDSAIALAVMAVVAGLLGWLLAGRAVRPLSLITATARRISEHNLNERLSFGGPKDELKDLADTIDGLLERLETAFNAQRRFVANASHELRTPLTTMRASLDVAMAKPAVPAQTEALAARLRAELDRVDQLLEGLLVLARAQHGTLPDTATFSLGDVASAAISARQAEIAGYDLTLRSLTTSDRAWVRGTQALVTRMIDNVIDNAIVHNEPGGWISVLVQADDAAASIVVENGGAQLDQEQVAELGQPFLRLGADRTGSDRGSGLGLSIVAAIVAAHGGSLDLRALTGGGLRVVITLPLADGPADWDAPR